MKDKAKLARDKFLELYSTIIKEAGNNLAAGLSQDQGGNYVIAARLNNMNCKGILPKSFDGFKVEVLIIGDIIAYTDKE